MHQEGKLSRAMAKSLRIETPADHGEPLGDQRGPVAPPPKRPVEKAAFRKVKNRGGDIISSAVILHDAQGEAAAQIRGLRARLLAMGKGHPPSVIAISSGGRSEGKTTVALNLALALSEINSGPVLLLDGDMLRPNVAAVTGVAATTGLSDILENDLDFNDSVYETSVPNLDVIPARAVTSVQESESPLHQRCGDLIAALRKYYSFVIVDTPPVLAGTQAGTFGKHCDGVVLVTRVEKTSRHVAKRAIDELEKAGATVFGCVLTHQKHHVPDFIYRFLGTTPSRYYRYGAQPRKPKEAAEGKRKTPAGEKGQ